MYAITRKCRCTRDTSSSTTSVLNYAGSYPPSSDKVTYDYDTSDLELHHEQSKSRTSVGISARVVNRRG